MSGKELFIKKAVAVHGDKYDYSKVDYVNNKTKVCIVCPKHGEFWQIPFCHTSRKNGCLCCANKQKSTKEDFVKKAFSVHGDKYDYSKVDYVNSGTKVTITCPKHGEFLQTPQNHLSGRGCPKCANELRNSGRVLKFNEFVKRANEIHGSKYDYVKQEIKNQKDKITIICPIHGEFTQEIDNHLHGHGCSKCGCGVSKQEEEIVSFLRANGIVVEERKRDLMPNGHKEIDIFLPNEKIGIEYNGLRWHSSEFNKEQNYHKNKTEECDKVGIKLIHIFEDEWINKKDIVKGKLLHILGVSNGRKVMARKTIVKDISEDTAKTFLEKNDVNGYSKALIFIGAFLNDELIFVASFDKNENSYLLKNTSSKINCICQGVFSKVIKYFERKYEFNKLVAYVDKRWSNNENVFKLLNFKFLNTVEPTYTYRFGNQVERVSKENLHKKVQELNRSRKKAISENDFFKLYDCGWFVYVKTSPPICDNS